jgi:predicted Zn-dependent protease
MAGMDLAKLRKLVALDENDPLSRFALGRKLLELNESRESLEEACEHQQFSNRHAPDHLATYHLLGQALIAVGRKDEAQRVLAQGIERVRGVGEGMGRDLGPTMQGMLDGL